MITLAFLVTSRRDLGPVMPYVFDLRPDGLYASPTITPQGQTRHLADPVLQGGPPQLNTAADGSATTTREESGLAVWAMDNIQNQAGGKTLALTPAQAAGFESGIFRRVDSGLDLTATDVDAVLNSIPGVSGSSAFPGSKTSSTGSLMDLLKILASYPYRVPMGSKLVDKGGDFPLDGTGKHIPTGSFQKPPVKVSSRVGLPPEPHRPPLTVPDSPAERAPLILTGELVESIRKGWLSKLVSPQYQFRRATFKYGPGGTAKTLGGQNIPGREAGDQAYRARAAVVYDQTGSLVK